VVKYFIFQLGGGKGNSLFEQDLDSSIKACVCFHGRTKNDSLKTGGCNGSADTI